MSCQLFRRAVLLRLVTLGESKRAHLKHISKEAGVEAAVDKFYRIMDAVTDECIEGLKIGVSGAVKGMLGGKLYVFFFNVTPLSVTSEGG